MLRSKSVIDAVVQLVGKIGCGPTASESVPFALDVQDLEPMSVLDWHSRSRFARRCLGARALAFSHDNGTRWNARSCVPLMLELQFFCRPYIEYNILLFVLCR
jgi:hypothetical protein